LAIVANFTATQNSGEPSQIVLTDTSTGSDVSITQRRVYLAKSDGTFLVPTGTTTEYIAWSYSDTTITIDALDKDYALEVTVEWLNVTNTVLYVKVSLYGFTLYNETFDYQCSQMLSANQRLANDNNFSQNRTKLRTELDSGNQALTFASDISASQLCYNRATDLRTNSQYFYNTNS